MPDDDDPPEESTPISSQKGADRLESLREIRHQTTSEYYAPRESFPVHSTSSDETGQSSLRRETDPAPIELPFNVADWYHSSTINTIYKVKLFINITSSFVVVIEKN